MAKRKQTELVEGPLGFPMREESARELDELIKTLPQDAEHEYRRKASAGEVTTDDEERTDKSFITTDSLDRDGEVVLPGGGNFSAFRKNPVVTFAHRYDELPVGKALWLKRDEQNGRKGILAKTQYAAKPADWGDAPWQPSAVWALVQQGILKGKSIGFLPLEVRPPTPKDVKARPEWEKAKLVINKWLLLEYAVAPVPSNPDALVQSIGKGLAVPDSLLEAMGMMVPDGGPEVPTEHTENTDREDMQIEMPEAKRVAFVTAEEYRKAIAGRDPVAALRGIDIEAAVRDELDRRRGRV